MLYPHKRLLFSKIYQAVVRKMSNIYVWFIEQQIKLVVEKVNITVYAFDKRTFGFGARDSLLYYPTEHSAYNSLSFKLLILINIQRLWFSIRMSISEGNCTKVKLTPMYTWMQLHLLLLLFVAVAWFLCGGVWVWVWDCGCVCV